MKYLFTLLVLLLAFIGCKKTDDETTVPADVLERNNWVVNTLKTDYLWESKLPAVLKPDIEPDTKAYFYRLLYQDDYWSYITDDFDGLIDALFGVYKDFGFTFVLTPLNSADNASNKLMATVQYVISGSPADEAKMKRGDMFNIVNGEHLSTSNYVTLLDNDTYKLEFISPNQTNEMIPLNRSVTIHSVVLEEDPIHTYTVLETDGIKVGYLMYNAFIYNKTDSTNLVNVFRYFDEQNIEELVLDLRYNGGGATYTATMLASMIVGKEHVENKAVFYSIIYNEANQNYFKRREGEDSPNLKVRFMDVPVNLNLKNLYVLTLNGTASASELIINGLDPYMNVVQIGDRTFGKYTISLPIPKVNSPDDTWGMLPIIAKSVNSKGVTDYLDGFAPDFYANDDLTHPLGDRNEEMLNVALSYIDGTLFPQNKSVIVPNNRVTKRMGGNALLSKGIMTLQSK